MRSVYKFGGSSIKCSTTIKLIAKTILSCPNDCFVILSATYNSTNDLERIFETKDLKLVDTFIAKHEQIVSELEIDLNLARFKEELVEYLTHQTSTSLLDSIYSIGERISTLILSTYMNQNGHENTLVDARDYIRTNSEFNNAKVLFTQTKSNISNLNLSKINITQGFIAKNLYGETTTLGREGSDYSASIFAWGIDDVEELVIWKDVNGVYGHDPKTIPYAPLINKMSYSQAKNLTSKGAKVLFHRTMEPLIQRGLTLKVMNVFESNDECTVIGTEVNDELKAITYKSYDEVSELVTIFGLQTDVIDPFGCQIYENTDEFLTLVVNKQDRTELISSLSEMIFQKSSKL